MQKCAEAVAVWLVRCQVIEEQEKELYCYANISVQGVQTR